MWYRLLSGRVMGLLGCGVSGEVLIAMWLLSMFWCIGVNGCGISGCTPYTVRVGLVNVGLVGVRVGVNGYGISGCTARVSECQVYGCGGRVCEC